MPSFFEIQRNFLPISLRMFRRQKSSASLAERSSYVAQWKIMQCRYMEGVAMNDPDLISRDRPQDTLKLQFVLAAGIGYNPFWYSVCRAEQFTRRQQDAEGSIFGYRIM
jgi:hypothetical protein